jgi:hypothetical protein
MILNRNEESLRTLGQGWAMRTYFGTTIANL